MIILFMNHIIHLIILNNFFKNIFIKVDRVNRFVIIILISFTLVLLEYIFFYNTNIFVKLCVNFSFYFLYILISFKNEIFKKFLYFGIFNVVLIVSELISGNILKFLFINDLFNNVNSMVYISALILTNILCFILLKFFKKIIYIKRDITFPKYSIMMIVWPLLIILIILCIDDYFLLLNDNKIVLILITILMVANYITFYLFYKSLVYFTSQKELEIIKVKQKVYEGNIALMENLYNTNFNFIHTLLHKLSDTNLLIEKNKFNKVATSLTEITNITYEEFNLIYSNSLILNLVLNSYKNILQSNNIYVNTIIEFNEFYFLNHIQLFDLFNQLLTIAINSCVNSKIVDKAITIKTKNINNLVFIQVGFCSSDYIQQNEYANEFDKIMDLIEELENVNSKINLREGVNDISILDISFQLLAME